MIPTWPIRIPVTFTQKWEENRANKKSSYIHTEMG